MCLRLMLHDLKGSNMCPLATPYEEKVGNMYVGRYTARITYSRHVQITSDVRIVYIISNCEHRLDHDFIRPNRAIAHWNGQAMPRLYPHGKALSKALSEVFASLQLKLPARMTTFGRLVCPTLVPDH